MMTASITSSTNATALGLADGAAVITAAGFTPPVYYQVTDEGAPVTAYALSSIDVGTPDLTLTGLAPWRRMTVHLLDFAGIPVQVPLAVGNDGSPTSGLELTIPTYTNPTDSEATNGSYVGLALSDAFVGTGISPGSHTPDPGYGCSFQFNGGRWWTWNTPGASRHFQLGDTVGLYAVRPEAYGVGPGTYTLRVRDAFGREVEASVELTAPPTVRGVWAPVPVLVAPTEPDLLTAVATLEVDIGDGGGFQPRGVPLRGRAKAFGELVTFDVSGYLQGLFPRSAPFSSEEWGANDLVRAFRLVTDAGPGTTRYVIDSALDRVGLLPWVVERPPTQRVLSPFWRLLPEWLGFIQPVFVFNDSTVGYNAYESPPEDFLDPGQTSGQVLFGALLVDFLVLPCPARPVDLVFLGRAGGWGRYVFNGKHEHSVTQDGGSLYRTAANENAWATTGDAYDTRQVVDTLPRWELAEAIAELRTSPAVWFNSGTAEAPEWKRAIIVRESFSIRREGDKRFPISFTLQLAEPLPIQGA